ncbi:MAG TPA: substrate-binding domain-containing protein [Terriglobales bacterium]|jgi:DNA-binding LacI/PurR family transcriptional regulator|nr:substrate-binding domain-containing protein [Terriglobales bacterium]
MKGSSWRRPAPLVGILLPALGNGYHAQLMGSVGDHLTELGCCYLTAQHRHRKDLIEQYSQWLVSRGAKALVAIDTALETPPAVPVVAVTGKGPLGGVTNLVLDHRLAAEQALMHLHSLGHRRIVFIRGQPFSSDSDDGWPSIRQVARELNIPIDPKLVIYLKHDIYSPDSGCRAMNDLLVARPLFTAVAAFNDISAIGAIRALQDHGLRVPADVSVIGFDDINAATFTNPRLTTIRQPLAQMGRIVAQCILKQLHAEEEFRKQIIIKPVLIVRESTYPARPLEPLEAHKTRRRIRGAGGTIGDAART